MRKVFSVVRSIFRCLTPSPIKQIGIIALLGVLMGIHMMKEIPEMIDGFAPVAVAILAIAGVFCFQFGELILPTRPINEVKDDSSPSAEEPDK